MPTETASQFPLAITILAYVATISLVLILLLLLRLSGQINALAIRLTKSTRSTRLAEPEEKPNIAESEPGTPFDEFLKEDSQRRTLSKKEQFKAYRKWRAEKGLNWVAPTGSE